MNACFFIGTYADGVYRLALSLEDGRRLSLTRAAAVPRPAWLTLRGNRLYAGSEMPLAAGRAGSLTTFAVTERGLEALGTLKNLPPLLVHEALMPASDYMMAASYGTGEVMSLRLRADGSLDPPAFVHVRTGRGAHPVRQTAAHPHSLWPVPRQSAFCLCDLGTDEVVWYDCNAQTGDFAQSAAGSVRLPAGQGPRHMVFTADGTRAFVLTEMGYHVYSLRVEDGGLRLDGNADVDPSLPARERAGASIRLSPDERYLYVTNRGAAESRVDILSVLPGGVKPVGRERGLAHPRDMILTQDGAFLLCANQKADSVTLFACQGQALTRIADIGGIPAPSCLVQA